MAVAGDVDGIGADDVQEQFGIGADVERLLLEFERPAGFRAIDEEPSRILAAGEEHRGKARAVAVEGGPAPADEKFPRTVVDTVQPRRLCLFMHERHVADRLRSTVLGGLGRAEGEERAKDAKDDPHHLASMTSERRKATTLSRSAGSSLR